MNVCLWMTNQCNLRCKYCYEKSKSDTAMSSSTVEQVVAFILKEYYCQTGKKKIGIQFHGGEPLLNFKNIKYVVELLKEYIEKDLLLFSMTTNGTLITDDIARFLFDNQFEVSISLDGLKESHDYNRIFKDNSGSFITTLRGLETLNKYFSNIRVRMTVTPETVGSLYKNITFLLSIGTRPRWCLDFSHNWTEPELDAYKEQLIPVRQLLENDERYSNVFFPRKHNKMCDGGISSYHISPIGYIYPCAYCVDNPKYLIGDITNGIDQNAVKRIHDLPPTYNMKCLECSKADGCVVTRCTLVNEVMTGNPYENNNLCNIERCLI